MRKYGEEVVEEDMEDDGGCPGFGHFYSEGF